jgi:hypothetical protein
MKRLSIIVLVLLLAGGMVSASDNGQRAPGNAQLSKTTGAPVYTFMNINNISTVYRNDGTSDIDAAQQNSGLVFPKGSKKTAMYSSGLIWAARIAGDPQVRVGGSGHRSGLQPGRILPNGSPEDPSLPHVRIYRVRPDYRTADLSSEIADEKRSAADIRARYETDWAEWPVAYGAPYKDVDSNGTYNPSVDIPGVPGADQTVWYVANDMNSTNTANLYGTQPLGIECQVTSWAYAQEGPLGNMIFRSYVLINKSSQRLDSMLVAMWSDPDLGFSDDDFAGCDTSLSLGFIYNAQNVDQTYGSLPPPSSGFDFFQGPIVAAPGATATFRGKYLQGYRNLPMTSFFYFIKSDQTLADPVQGDPAGATQMFNFMRGRVGLTGQYFQDPQGNPTTFVLTGDPVRGTGWLDGQQYPMGDRRMGLASGPFSMAPGDTQEVVIAEICAGAIPGVDRLTAVSLLKFYDKSAQLAYDNFFSLPSPPSAPKVTVTELNEEILLNWGSDPVAVQATESTDNRGFRFQGYNVYQLPSAGASISQGRKIAVYDLAGDGVTRITDQVFDATVGVVTGKVVQLGTDSGIKRFFSVTGDALNSGAPLVNGLRYYFAVTSYSYNADPNAVPNNLENPLAIITAVPHSNNPGVRYAGTAGDTIRPVNHTGNSDGSVVPMVVDPARTTGQSYKVMFEDNAGTVTWKLVNTTRGDTLLRGQTNQSGDDDYLVTEGVQVKVLGPPAGMKNWTIPTGTRRWTWAGGADGFGMEGFTGAMGSALHGWGDGVSDDRLRNVKLQLCATDTNGNVLDPNDPDLSYAYRYVRGAQNAPAKPSFGPFITNASGSYAYQGYAKSIPFAAYNMETNPPTRLMVGHVENNVAGGLVDGKYWPPVYTDADNVASTGPREWFFIFDVPYSVTPDPSLTVNILNETGVPIMYFCTPARRAAVAWEANDEFLIETNHINAVNDVFAFTSPAVTYDVASAKVDAAKINVFPNPYYGVNTEEINKYNRFVTFTHLPQEALIRIYNLAGVQVREIRKNSASQFERWDLANESGLPVGSGLYIVHIDMPGLDGAKKILKLAIVQEQQILDRF